MAEYSSSVLDMDERRAYARLATDKATQARVRNTNRFHRMQATGEQGSDGLPVRVTDISFSGVRILAPSSCGDEGDTMEVHLRGEDYETLTLAGRVVRVESGPDGHAMGLHFYNVAVQDQQRLAGVLSKWSKLPANSKGVRRSPISPWTRSQFL